MMPFQLIIDTTCGASGDMLLAALLDIHPVETEFIRRFESLGLDVQIECRQTEKNHLRCRQLIVHTRHHSPIRHFHDIESFIEKSPFSLPVKESSRKVFQRIFEAEAAVHGEEFSHIHLHELGADDSLVDILGFCYLWEALQFPPIFFTPFHTGRGTVKTEHGILPVPPPAVLKLLEGIPFHTGEVESELLTPTGAAVLTTLGRPWDPRSVVCPVRTGIGCGERTFPQIPNILRAILSEIPDAVSTDEVRVIEFFVDDMSGEAVSHLGETLMKQEAVDLFIAPGIMKKGRPGFHFTLLCRPEKEKELIGTIFRESTTIGLRSRSDARITLERSTHTLSLGADSIRYKVSRFEGKAVTIKPEFDDVQRWARDHSISFKEAMARITRKIYEQDEFHQNPPGNPPDS